MTDEFNKHAFLPGSSVACIQGSHDVCDGRAFLEDHDGHRPYSCHCGCHSPMVRALVASRSSDTENVSSGLPEDQETQT